MAMLAPSSNFSLPVILRDNYFLNLKYIFRKMEKILQEKNHTVKKVVIISGDISNQETGVNGPKLTFKMLNQLFSDYPPIHFIQTPGTRNHTRVSPQGRISILKRNQGEDLLGKDLSELAPHSAP